MLLNGLSYVKIMQQTLCGTNLIYFIDNLLNVLVKSH